MEFICHLRHEYKPFEFKASSVIDVTTKSLVNYTVYLAIKQKKTIQLLYVKGLGNFTALVQRFIKWLIILVK
jgi:hypothetical protein